VTSARIPAEKRVAIVTLCLGLFLAGAFAGLVVLYGHQLRADIRQKMIERDAAVLYSVAQQQIEITDSLNALLPDARREGMLALALFDESGVAVEKIPASQPLVDLSLDDFVQLQNGKTISRFHPAFPLSTLLVEAAPGQTSPVLEVLLPLHRRAHRAEPIGFVRYHLDARQLSAKLDALDASVQHKLFLVLALGLTLIGLIVAAAHLALTRAQRSLAERSAGLARANFELTLASKASALGQITSHLIHGLKGPVSGLQAVMRSGNQEAAANYAERIRSLIQEATDLLSDQSAQASYELTTSELAELIKRRHAATAEESGITIRVHADRFVQIDSHRGSLLCLIINNLVCNAIEASQPGKRVEVTLSPLGEYLQVSVADEGSGIPDEVRSRLFTPGCSGRAGGTGLGLTISQLLSRQIGATLELITTGKNGTVFRATMPLKP